MAKGNVDFIKAWSDIIYSKDECHECEGYFQHGEERFRDYKNNEYCKACFRDKYGHYVD